MTDTIASLAAELGAQPHELAAFADLGNVPQDEVLDGDTADMIREAWAVAPAHDSIDSATENANEAAVLDNLADFINGIGYTDSGE